MTPIEPWQVWLVNFDPQVGHEQWGRRPAIVVGGAVLCRIAPELALVVPCTTRDRRMPYQPRVALERPSVAMCEQVKSVSRDRLVRLLPHEVEPEARVLIRETVTRLLAR